MILAEIENLLKQEFEISEKTNILLKKITEPKVVMPKEKDLSNLINQLTSLPVFPEQSPERFNFFLKLGNFFEQNFRQNQTYDLHCHPNPAWKIIEASMLTKLDSFLTSPNSSTGLEILQWYNSGVFIKIGHEIFAFDILPIPRFYDWEEPSGLSEKIASAISALFITHSHQDHLDPKLIHACAQNETPVFMHADEASSISQSIIPVKDKERIEIRNTEFIGNHAYHVWREKISDQPLCFFEFKTKGNFSVIFCGDADYTKVFNPTFNNPDLIFVPWRNPNQLYENGHPEQKYSTQDAINDLCKKLNPKQIILEHYGELDHIYKGFSASYDMAINIIENSSLPVYLLFWGESISI